jgi:Tat protein secretion system quality control protein TatD with DNase activity
LIDKGFYISLNHSIFKKEDIDFNVLPLEKLFLETDNNESVLIEEVYQKAAACFHITR